MLIGEPGARKSTAIKQSRKVLAKAGYEHFAAEKTTKEKFLLDLEGIEEQDNSDVTNKLIMENLGLGDASDPKEVFIVADEFNDFMRCGDLEFHSMLGVLWDYDDETTLYKQRLKNSKSIAIYQPTINILSGNTHTNFAEMFPPQAIGQGFLSRMILVFSEPSGKKIAFPEPPNPTLEDELVTRLRKLKKEAIGAIRLESKAKEMLGVLYNTYQGFSDVRFTPYFTRRYTHLLKLALICAACNAKDSIGPEEVVLANTILSYTEHFMPKALGEFGKAKNSDVAATVIKLLEAGPDGKPRRVPMDIPEIWKHVSNNLDKIEQLGEILQGLTTAGKVMWVAKSRKEGAQGFLITRARLGTGQLYVDYNLLKEYEQFKLN